MRILIESFKSGEPVQNVTQEKQDKFRTGLETIISFTSQDIKNILDSKEIAKTEEEVKILNSILNTDISNLNNQELLLMHNVVSNIITNGNYSDGYTFVIKDSAINKSKDISKTIDDFEGTNKIRKIRGYKGIMQLFTAK